MPVHCNKTYFLKCICFVLFVFFFLYGFYYVEAGGWDRVEADRSKQRA